MLVFRNVEVAGRPGQDCVVRDGVVAAVGPGLDAGDAEVVDGRGGALLPGLADHHLHLLATAAAQQSVDLSQTDSLEVTLSAAGGAWIRAVGYDDGRHGPLDRDRLDRIVGDRPVRVQHRSGALWVLSTRALAEVGIDDRNGPDGAERDPSGRPTGRLWRSDDWLSAHPVAPPPDLGLVGARLAGLGVTAVTDATPELDVAAVALLHDAMTSGALPQRVQLLADVKPGAVARLTVGPRKIVVADHDLPAPDDLTARVDAAHRDGRPVAVHCVSRAALALTIAALRAAGARRGDRIEHCALADDAAVRELAGLGVVVVTQPSLVARRGDDYLDRHDQHDRTDLWRFASLCDAGVATVASSDSPYGDPDPWHTLRAARDRRTARGRVLGEQERMPVEATLRGLLAHLDDPGGAPRRVAVGAPGDLVLLAVPLAVALRDPSAELVRVTVVGGRVAAAAD